MKSKLTAVIMVILLLAVLAAGCSNSKTKATGKDNKAKTESKQQVDKPKEPVPNPVSEDQKKHPLPDGALAYTGTVKSVDGNNVTVDVRGADLDFTITGKTVLQKGTDAGSGKLEDIKPPLNVNVLIKAGEALSVQYK